MPYSLRTFVCIECGQPFQHRRRPGSRPRCHPCAIAYSAEVQRQLAAHQGPHWERWAWNNALAARRMLSSPAPGESLSQAS